MTTWSVSYSGLPALGRVVSRVDISDPDFGVGNATHTITTGSMTDGKRIADFYKDLITLEGKPLEFKFVSDGEESRVWKHSVIKVTLLHRQNTVGGFAIKVLTADRGAILHLGAKALIHKPDGNKVSNTVKDILQKAGLKTRTIQETDRSDDYSRICQPNITDYRFISDFLMPRSVSSGKSGFRLWSVDGESYDYICPDYQAKEITLPNESVESVEDSNTSFDSNKLGGYFLQSFAVNPFTKTVLESQSEDSNKPLGEYYGEWRTPAISLFPAWTQESLDAQVKNTQRSEADYAYPFSVRMVGTTKVNGSNVERPAIITVNAGHKTSSKITGILGGIGYTYHDKKLMMTLNCLRYQTTL